ncbi:MAG: hypothetical protein EBU90_01585 [Proteobacteria bacterium]|nr:hypothetical protein [Pseudomonadota bacterium]
MNITFIDYQESISKVIRDLGLRNNEIPDLDFIEWIAECLKDIGSYYQLVEVNKLLTVNDYRAVLPLEAHTVRSIIASCEYPSAKEMLASAGSYQITYYNTKIEEIDVLLTTETNPDVIEDLVRKKEIYKATRDERIKNITYIQGDYPADMFHLFASSGKVINSLKYVVQGNYIDVEFRHGFVAIKYLAFPVDDCGIPLIPNTQNTKTAIFWKIVMQLCIQGSSFLKNEALKNLDYVTKQYQRFTDMARAEINTPDAKTIMSIAHQYHKMIPTNTDFSQRFVNLGKERVLKLR